MAPDTNNIHAPTMVPNHAYQFKLGPYIVNKSCTVNAVLGCPLLDLVQFMPDIMFVMKIVFRNFKTNK